MSAKGEKEGVTEEEREGKGEPVAYALRGKTTCHAAFYLGDTASILKEPVLKIRLWGRSPSSP